MLALINPFMIPLAAAALTILYLRRELEPPAPETTPVSVPYTPPFTGGQCVGSSYNFKLDYRVDINGVDTSIFGFARPIDAVGALRGVEVTETGSGFQWYLLDGSGRSFLYEFPRSANTANPKAVISDVTRIGGIDNCGDPPNPNTSPPIASDGLADSEPPGISEDDRLVQGSPIVAIPALASVLKAIRSAIAAAATALEAIKLVMDAIKAIGDVLDKIKDWIDKKEKDEEKNKSLFYHNYGSIKKDGFLRLYPLGEFDGYEPVYIDLQLLSIPIGYGKYFGKLSPNFYRFKSLGHISFVSSSFGVLETKEIEFSRVSMAVPENAYGFYYHLGLEGVIRANASLFYLRYEEGE